MADLLDNTEEDQVEVDEGSDFSEVMEKPSSPQVGGAIDILMNFAMVTGSTELRALTVQGPMLHKEKLQIFFFNSILYFI